MSDNRKDMIELALERAALFVVGFIILALAYQGLYCLLRH